MKADVNREMRFATVGGIKTRYRIRGEGFPLIFVHGLMGSIEQEDTFAGEKARLTENYMVVHYDCRGRGKTDAGSYETRHYTWEGQAEDLWALMQHLGIERAHLIGGSQGAAVVPALAIRQPQAVASMVLHNPPEVRALDQEYISGILDYADFIEREGMDAVTELILKLPPNDTLAKTHPRLIAHYDGVMRSQDARVIAAATRAIVSSAPMTKEELNVINAPTLIIASEGDGLHPTDVGRFLKECLPDARELFGPTITYFGDNPNLASGRILDFYTEIDGIKWD